MHILPFKAYQSRVVVFYTVIMHFFFFFFFVHFPQIFSPLWKNWPPITDPLSKIKIFWSSPTVFFSKIFDPQPPTPILERGGVACHELRTRKMLFFTSRQSQSDDLPETLHYFKISLISCWYYYYFKQYVEWYRWIATVARTLSYNFLTSRYLWFRKVSHKFNRLKFMWMIMKSISVFLPQLWECGGVYQ